MASNEADETLQAARAGDSTALDRLWTEHRRWIAVVLLAHMPREAEVEDMLQDVALKLVRGVSEVEDPATLRPWLRSVALNTARSAGRKASLRRRILRRLDPDDLQIADPGSERGMRALEAKWAAQRALDASRDLAPEYREPLLLRVLEGMSQRAIAEALELPETTVESRLARARKMLRERLAEERNVAALTARVQGE